MKQKPSLITSPPVTLDEIAKTFKISKKRRKELEEMMLETMAETARKRSSPKAGSKSKSGTVTAAKRRQSPVC